MSAPERRSEIVHLHTAGGLPATLAAALGMLVSGAFPSTTVVESEFGSVMGFRIFMDEVDAWLESQDDDEA